jgi:hypothetical protein
VALFFTEEAVEICSLMCLFKFGTQYLSCVPGAAAVDPDRIAVNLMLFQLDKRMRLEFTKGADIAL